MSIASSNRRQPSDVAADSTVLTALAAATNGNAASSPELVARNPLSWGSSHFIEILDVVFGGEDHQILCKYAHEYARGGAEHVDASFGHRKGVKLEALVYRDLISHSGLSAPRFYGSHSDGNGQTWLFLEHLDGALRVSKVVPYIDGLVAAATWIGHFHRKFAGRKPPMLQPFDEDYFAGWAHRTVGLMDEISSAPDWLRLLAKRSEDWAPELAGGPLTAIHGEYYMHNILHYRGAVYPIDWETAAWAIGEIDLATLTEDVEADISEACLSAYSAARWPDGRETDTERRLSLARLYLHVRWLGEDIRATRRQYEWRLPLLHAEATRLGLV